MRREAAVELVEAVEQTSNGQLSPEAAEAIKAAISRKAHDLGFDLVGFTTAAPFPNAQEALQKSISAGYFSGLPWFSGERAAIAGDPRNLMSTARTIISLGISYLSDEERVPSAPGDPRGRVARYAWGRDYHEVFREKMRALHLYVQEQLGRPVDARTLVDTARIVDRAAAQRAGLGWYGKNTNILNRRFGSWILLGEILLDVELPPDEPVRTHCGSCTRCMPACPTGALVAPGVLVNDLCISYLTIEHRGVIPRDKRALVGDWIFGCDICQDVCPVNSKAEAGNHHEFSSATGIGPSPSLVEILDMSEEEFRTRFRNSPVRRTKLTGLRRNAAVALGNIADPATVPALERALNSEPALVRGHAAWALGRVGTLEARSSLERRMMDETDSWVREEISLALEEIEGATRGDASAARNMNEQQ